MGAHKPGTPLLSRNCTHVIEDWPRSNTALRMFRSARSGSVKTALLVTATTEDILEYPQVFTIDIYCSHVFYASCFSLPESPRPFFFSSLEVDF